MWISLLKIVVYLTKLKHGNMKKIKKTIEVLKPILRHTCKLSLMIFATCLLIGSIIYGNQPTNADLLLIISWGLFK
jgi:hypothetical protein